MSKQVMTKDDGEATHDHNNSSSSSNNNDDDDDDDDDDGSNNGNNNSSEENKGREARTTSTNDKDTTNDQSGLWPLKAVHFCNIPMPRPPSHPHTPTPPLLPLFVSLRERNSGGESERGRAEEEDRKSTDVLCGVGRDYGAWARTRLTQSTQREGKGLCHSKRVGYYYLFAGCCARICVRVCVCVREKR